MGNFKPNWKTTEFITTCIEILALGVSLYFNLNPNIWACAFTASVCGYIISRGLFKKSRLALIYNGQKTSEFFFYCAGIIALILNWHFLGASLSVTISCVVIFGLSFKLSRGWAKGLPQQTKVMNF